MILTETNLLFPLSSVKPLEGLAEYRNFCLVETDKTLKKNSILRTKSPLTGSPLNIWNSVGQLSYAECNETQSLFLTTVSDNKNWGKLLSTVSEQRSKKFHQSVAGSRASNVHIPKLEWVESSLRMQGKTSAAVLEIKTAPSKISSLLRSSRIFTDVQSRGEVELLDKSEDQKYDAAIAFESFDRVNDPVKLSQEIANSLKPGGFIFATALVSSGFDMKVLGEKNLYLCPPDRTNCFSLKGIEMLLINAGFKLLEVSTPGVLDLEIVQEHNKKFSDLNLSDFEKNIIEADEHTQRNFQAFLQKSGLSSFARIVGRKE